MMMMMMMELPQNWKHIVDHHDHHCYNSLFSYVVPIVWKDSLQQQQQSGVELYSNSGVDHKRIVAIC
jgi:hypothetical protein